MDSEKGKGVVWRSQYSSGGTLQNEVVPTYVNMMMSQIIALDQDDNTIVLLLNTLKAMYALYCAVLTDQKAIMDEINLITAMAKDWEKKRNTNNAIAIKTKLYNVTVEFFNQWNRSGAGLVLQKYIPGRERRIYNAITGNTADNPTSETET